MEASLLDAITNAFVSALQGGLSTLSVYSIPLLAVFSVIAFYTQMWPLLASGSGMAAEALAATLLGMVKFGVFFWILINLAEMTTPPWIRSFSGDSPPGGACRLGTFQQPSAIINLGFAIAKPLWIFTVAGLIAWCRPLPSRCGATVSPTGPWSSLFCRGPPSRHGRD